VPARRSGLRGCALGVLWPLLVAAGPPAPMPAGGFAGGITGLPRALEATAPSSGTVRQNLDIAAFAAESGLALEPLVIEQHSDTDDGLERDWPRADLGIDRNEGYALQWYTFAALAIVLAIVLSFRRGPER